MELEEQIKEYRKNLIFKAVPMPAFYKAGSLTQRSKLSRSERGKVGEPIPSDSRQQSRSQRAAQAKDVKAEKTPRTIIPKPIVNPKTPTEAKAAAGDRKTEEGEKEVKVKVEKAPNQGPTWSVKRSLSGKEGKSGVGNGVGKEGAVAGAGQGVRGGSTTKAGGEASKEGVVVTGR